MLKTIDLILLLVGFPFFSAFSVFFVSYVFYVIKIKYKNENRDTKYSRHHKNRMAEI